MKKKPIPITAMIDEDLVKKLRKVQAKMLLKSNDSVSFSKVLSQYLEQGLKNGRH